MRDFTNGRTFNDQKIPGGVEADSIGGAGDSLVLKLKHHLAKAAETFPNNAALCHLASVHHAGVLTRTPHVMPHAIHALTCRQIRAIPAGAEHSELAAKVSLFVHRKWHGKTATEKSAAEKTASAANGDSADEKTATAANGNADEKTAAADGNSCDCNILSIVDRVPSSKAAYISAIEYFSKDGNEKQAMELHHVLIEKHLRVHIPFEMVKVLSSNTTTEQKFLRDELSWVSNLDKTELSSWVRVETDRSSVHFGPVSTISTCIDDTERYCLPDDVIKFVRPVPSLEGLLSVSLALMKVPPLPLSHSAYILCFLGTADNTGDDAELLATGHFSLLSHLDTRECPCYLNASPPLLPDLISPPSYILPSLHPPHDKYLRLVLDWWRTAVGLLDDYQQIPMYVWLFRFLRSLFVSPENRTKDLYDRSKALIKDVLKQEKFRSAVPLYIEFAYFERDYGKMEEGIKVLSKLLDSTLPASNCDPSSNCDPTRNGEDKPTPSANLLAAARALIILMVQNKQKTEALVKYKELLGKLFSLDLTFTSTTPSSSPLLSLIRSSIDRHLSSLNHSEELFLRSLYESHLPTELILTGAWLIYLSARETSGKHEPDSGVSASEENVYAYLTGYIERFEAGRSLNVSFHVKETLTEQLCVFLADSIGGAGDSLVLKLKHHLAKAAETFPNNAALCHLASVHHAGVLTRTPHVLPHAFHALTCRQIPAVPAGAEHSELAAKVSLFVHRKWHGKTATEKYTHRIFNTRTMLWKLCAKFAATRRCAASILFISHGSL
ncbi:uncharacterized protein LOC103514671 [Diaphorina citri]|uniref:Uncharacterized protein LOC103514671 n=1 Tax=Diaphorina citri TaxID=121845 RepID=A0A3Q0J4F3_DIACI|nr:uncharacterized protein LOC103514671 [Diaphorina citri]